MAINPNFVFQDPRIQAGVIGMAQIAAAEEAARLQRQSQSQQSFTQAQVARDNATAERARNDSYLAQSERESARADATRNKDLELRRTVEENYRKAYEADRGAVGADREKAARAKAQEATLQKIAENVNDPVPPTEWATNKVRYGADLSPSQIDSLDQTWKQTREAVRLRFDEAAGRASGWTTKLRDALETIKDDPKGTIRQSRINSILDEFTKSKQEDLKFDPASGGFVSIFRRLREDPPKGPGAAPASEWDWPPRSSAQGVSSAARIPLVEEFLPTAPPRPPVARSMELNDFPQAPPPVSRIPIDGAFQLPPSVSQNNTPQRFSPIFGADVSQPPGPWTSRPQSLPNFMQGVLQGILPPEPLAPPFRAPNSGTGGFLPPPNAFPSAPPAFIPPPPAFDPLPPSPMSFQPPPANMGMNQNNILMALANLFQQGRGMGMRAPIQNPVSSFYVT